MQRLHGPVLRIPLRGVPGQFELRVGHREPGRDGIHAYPMFAEFLPDGVSEPEDASLTGAVVDEAGYALEEGRRAQIDYLAVALSLHVGKDRLDAEPHAPHIDGLHRVPLLHGPLVERTPRPHATEDSGIVHEDVDAAVPALSHEFGGRLALLEIGDVAGYWNRDTAGFQDLVGDLGRALHVDIEHRDPSAFPSVAEAYRAADAVRTTAPCDDGHPALKTARRPRYIGHRAHLPPPIVRTSTTLGTPPRITRRPTAPRPLRIPAR